MCKVWNKSGWWWRRWQAQTLSNHYPLLNSHCSSMEHMQSSQSHSLLMPACMSKLSKLLKQWNLHIQTFVGCADWRTKLTHLAIQSSILPLQRKHCITAHDRQLYDSLKYLLNAFVLPDANSLTAGQPSATEQLRSLICWEDQEMPGEPGASLRRLSFPLSLVFG